MTRHETTLFEEGELGAKTVHACDVGKPGVLSNKELKNGTIAA
jgi:hypothetical protein